MRLFVYHDFGGGAIDECAGKRIVDGELFNFFKRSIDPSKQSHSIWKYLCFLKNLEIKLTVLLVETKISGFSCRRRVLKRMLLKAHLL